MSANRIQFIGTTAEVAKTISTLPDGQLPEKGKGLSPKDLPDAKQGKPWGCTEYVQNCHQLG